MRSNGFTLLDLLITLTVMSILVGIAIPSFSSQIKHSRVETATLGLVEAMELARTQAVSANIRTTMRKTDKWEDGWAVFVDNDNDGQLDPDEHLLQRHEKLVGVKISANTPIKTFVSYVGSGESRNANGTNNGAFQAGTFTICPTTKGEGYQLIIARGGRVRSSKISAQECSNF